MSSHVKASYSLARRLLLRSNAVWSSPGPATAAVLSAPVFLPRLRMFTPRSYTCTFSRIMRYLSFEAHGFRRLDMAPLRAFWHFFSWASPSKTRMTSRLPYPQMETTRRTRLACSMALSSLKLGWLKSRYPPSACNGAVGPLRLRRPRAADEGRRRGCHVLGHG